MIWKRIAYRFYRNRLISTFAMHAAARFFFCCSKKLNWKFIFLFIYFFAGFIVLRAAPHSIHSIDAGCVWTMCVCTLFDRVFVCLFNECTMHVLRVWINGDANIFIRTTTTDSRRKSPIWIQLFGENYSSASNRRNSAMIEMSKCMGAQRMNSNISFRFYFRRSSHTCVCVAVSDANKAHWIETMWICF